MSIVWGSKKLNRSNYLFPVSHCELLGYKFKLSLSESYYEIWHPKSGKKVDCALSLVKRYFGTGRKCDLIRHVVYENPDREIWKIKEKSMLSARNSIYGEFITSVYLGEYSLESELFEI